MTIGLQKQNKTEHAGTWDHDRHLAQVYFNMQNGVARKQTTDLPIGRRLTLARETLMTNIMPADERIYSLSKFLKCLIANPPKQETQVVNLDIQ